MVYKKKVWGSALNTRKYGLAALYGCKLNLEAGVETRVHDRAFAARKEISATPANFISYTLFGLQAI